MSLPNIHSAELEENLESCFKIRKVFLGITALHIMYFTIELYLCAIYSTFRHSFKGLVPDGYCNHGWVTYTCHRWVIGTHPCTGLSHWSSLWPWCPLYLCITKKQPKKANVGWIYGINGAHHIRAVPQNVEGAEARGSGPNTMHELFIFLGGPHVNCLFLPLGTMRDCFFLWQNQVPCILFLKIRYSTFFSWNSGTLHYFLENEVPCILFLKIRDPAFFSWKSGNALYSWKSGNAFFS
jgi:hypothetical protein